MYHRSSLRGWFLNCHRYRHQRRPDHYRHCHHFLYKDFSTTTPQLLELPLTYPTYIIWGSNTGVGKTLVSSGLAASTVLSSPSKFLYLKPIQTGFPSDSDSRFVFSKLCSLSLRRSSPFTLCASNELLNTSVLAENAMLGSRKKEDSGNEVYQLGEAEKKRVVGDGSLVSELVCKTMFAWKEAVSPHLAAEREGGAVKDLEVLEWLQRCLRNGMEGEAVNDKSEILCVVETSGGVASPGPSGSLQCDLYR